MSPTFLSGADIKTSKFPAVGDSDSVIGTVLLELSFGEK